MSVLSIRIQHLFASAALSWCPRQQPFRIAEVRRHEIMSDHFRDTCLMRAIAVNLDVGLPRLQGFDQEVGEQARGGLGGSLPAVVRLSISACAREASASG
jgi:hypothetical protein